MSLLVTSPGYMDDLLDFMIYSVLWIDFGLIHTFEVFIDFVIHDFLSLLIAQNIFLHTHIYLYIFFYFLFLG